jgi:hypothetical protein
MICNECETVAHCLKHGCIPKQPAPVQEPVATVTSESGNPDVTMSWWHEPPLPVGTKLYTTPPAQPAPVQDCFWKREGYKECPAAQPAVPDALTSADIQEHIEYVAGWNDCRQAMLEMMK